MKHRGAAPTPASGELAGTQPRCKHDSGSTPPVGIVLEILALCLALEPRMP